jgi:hypothetical protein
MTWHECSNQILFGLQLSEKEFLCDPHETFGIMGGNVPSDDVEYDAILIND